VTEPPAPDHAEPESDATEPVPPAESDAPAEPTLQDRFRAALPHATRWLPGKAAARMRGVPSADHRPAAATADG
jgi:hypothetical protein